MPLLVFWPLLAPRRQHCFSALRSAVVVWIVWDERQKKIISINRLIHLPSSRHDGVKSDVGCEVVARDEDGPSQVNHLRRNGHIEALYLLHAARSLPAQRRRDRNRLGARAGDCVGGGLGRRAAGPPRGAGDADSERPRGHERSRYMCAYRYGDVCMYLSSYLAVYLFRSRSIYESIYMSMSISLCISIYVAMYLYIYMYTYI